MLDGWLKGEARKLRDFDGLSRKAQHVLQYVRGPILQSPAQCEVMKRAYLDAGLSPATINRRLSIVRRVCNIAFDQGLIATPIGKRIKLMPEQNERHLYLSPKDVEGLAAIAGGEAGNVIRALAYTGLRAGELFALRPEHLRDGMIYLTPDITKSSKPRAIPIPPVMDKIRLPLEINRTRFEREFRKARRAYGMDNLRPHDLRHTYASLLAGVGANMAAIRDLLGHSSLSTTSRYAHLLGEHLREVTRGIGQ